MLFDLGRFHDNRVVLRKAIERGADQSECRLGIAVAYAQEKNREAAIDALALLKPDEHCNTETLYEAALIFQQFGAWIDVIDFLDVVISRKPGHTEAILRRGLAFALLGEPQTAINDYHRALDVDADYHQVHSNILGRMQYDPANSATDILQAHTAWANRFASAHPIDPQTFEKDRDLNRKLIVGWLSPRFDSSLVRRFLPDTVKNMPESAFGHIFYGSRPEKNTTSNSLQALGPVRQISELEDQDLAQVILDDGVDILIDLAGHNPGNRLIAISRRLAPIQISWLDYFSTTGVPAMDYWFSDKYLTPDGSSESFSESLILLPDTRLCYSPPKFNIDPARSIRTENEIVFGSFNRLGKLVDELIAVWTNILNRVEHSRLVLKAYEFQDKRVRNHTIARFEEAGLSPGQLELRNASPYSQLLSEYADIDIALDTFPFTGCATTCDALWMGVPVVSCYGESVVSRQGLSILQNIGKSDWLADQADVYTATAIGLAESIRVNGFDRKELRETVKTSTLCNAPAFGKAFSEQLRVLWRTYCEQSN